MIILRIDEPNQLEVEGRQNYLQTKVKWRQRRKRKRKEGSYP
jgi:hypothetical protein